MEFVIVTGQMVLDVAPDIARTCAYAQDVQNFPSSPVVGLRIAEAKQVLSALGLRFPTAEEAQSACIEAKRSDGFPLSDFRVHRPKGFTTRWRDENTDHVFVAVWDVGRNSTSKARLPTKPEGSWTDEYGGDNQHSDVLVVGVIAE